MFNQQGLEKYNDQCSKDYFRSTNHKGVEALRQMMLKKNRMQLMQVSYIDRTRRKYICSNCSGVGHSVKTCVKKCSKCGYHTFCGHINKVDGKWVPVCSVSADL